MSSIHTRSLEINIPNFFGLGQENQAIIPFHIGSLVGKVTNAIINIGANPQQTGQSLSKGSDGNEDRLVLARARNEHNLKFGALQKRLSRVQQPILDLRDALVPTKTVVTSDGEEQSIPGAVIARTDYYEWLNHPVLPDLYHSAYFFPLDSVDPRFLRVAAIHAISQQTESIDPETHSHNRLHKSSDLVTIHELPLGDPFYEDFLMRLQSASSDFESISRPPDLLIPLEGNILRSRPGSSISLLGREDIVEPQILLTHDWVDYRLQMYFGQSLSNIGTTNGQTKLQISNLREKIQANLA
jgi:hypothetical protein